MDRNIRALESTNPWSRKVGKKRREKIHPVFLHKIQLLHTYFTTSCPLIHAVVVVVVVVEVSQASRRMHYTRGFGVRTKHRAISVGAGGVAACRRNAARAVIAFSASERKIPRASLSQSPFRRSLFKRN